MIRAGGTVEWKWGRGIARGKVEETFDHSVTRTIKGSEITRKGDAQNKVLLIRQEDGDQVLKLESEVEQV